MAAAKDATTCEELLRDARAALAVRLAQSSGALLRDAFFGDVRADNKQARGFDPVTAADRAAEERMRAMIAEAFPADGILGEELGAANAGAAWQWVLDPIDGTRAFLCGLPGFATLIALLHEGTPTLGIIHEPLTGLLLIGNNRACWQVRDGKAQPAKVRPPLPLQEALAGTTLPRLYDTLGKRAFLDTLQKRARHVQFDADALFYAAVARGRMDVALDTGLQPHDAAALIPVVRGAGGRITDWCGNDAVMGGDIIASSGGALHEALLELLAETGAAEEAACR